MQNVVFYRSPLGTMLLATDEVGLTGAWFEGQKYFVGTLTEGAREERSPVTDEVARSLFFGGGSRFSAAASSDRFAVSAGGVGAAVRRSVRGNGHIRRIGRPSAGEKRRPPRIGQGGRRCRCP